MPCTVTREYAICQDCLIWLANADASGVEPERQASFLARLASFETRPDHPGHVVAVGDALGFRHDPCDSCGGLAGDRFLAVRLTDVPPVVV